MRSTSKFVLKLKRVIQLIYYNKLTTSYDSAISFCRIYTLILPQILLLLAVAKARKGAKENRAINSNFANSLRKFSPSLHASNRVFDLLKCKGRELKELRNFILSQGLQISAISSFNGFIKRANWHPNGVKMAIFSQKFTNLSSGFGALLQAPACGGKQKTSLTKQFLVAHLIVICV